MTDKIRIGLIGLGERGTKTLLRYQDIENATIVAIADTDPKKVDQAATLLENRGIRGKSFFGEQAWKEICLYEDVDLIYICTDWSSHTAISLYAMNHGKDVACEVPAATTIEECWQLIETKERTGREFFMTENCCYDLFTLGTLEMKRLGVLGDIRHCEGAYIHNFLSKRNWIEQNKSFKREWMREEILLHEGNPYPTHGLGPAAWLMDIHRGDRMDYLISMSSFNNCLPIADSRVNSTLIKTVKGKSILLQFDVTTPRPYSRRQTVCGTIGFVEKYPQPTIELEDGIIKTEKEAWELMQPYLTSHAAQLYLEGEERGVANAMNYAMDRRLIYCLQHNIPVDIDVYDAVAWSCISPLSRLSILKEGEKVKIPDFSRRKWKTIPPQEFKIRDKSKKDK